MEYKNETFDMERALYGITDSVVENCRFDGPQDGESAMKEASGIVVRDCFMNCAIRSGTSRTRRFPAPLSRRTAAPRSGTTGTSRLRIAESTA